MYQYPYGNAQQLNLDWLMEQWQEVKQSIDGSLQGEIDRVEAAITDLLAARDAAVAAAGAANTSAGAAAASAQAAAADAATATAQAAAATQERVNAAQAANNAQSYAGTAQTQAAAAQNAAGQAAASASQAAADASDAHDDAVAASGSAVNAAASAAGALQNFQLSDAARQAAQAAEQDAEAAATLLQPPATSADIGKALIVKTVGGGTVTAYELGESGGGGGTPAIINTIEDVPVASFDDGTVNPVHQLVIDIEPVQAGSGDPSYPNNVRPITGWTMANVAVTGKNLFNKATAETGYVKNDGSVAPNAEFACSDYIKCLPNTAYYTNANTSNRVGVIVAFDAVKNFISSFNTVNNVFTTPANTAYIRVNTEIASTSIDQLIVKFSNQGDTDYKPFGTVYEIEFPDTVGTVYGATLENGGTDTWKLRQYKASITFDGSSDESWSLTGSTRQYFGIAISNFKNPASAAYPPNMISSSYRIVSVNAADASIDIVASGYNGQIRVYDVTAFETLENWKAHLAQNPLQVVYELATPVEYTFTTTEVITLLAGNNNVWSDTGNINILQYYADSKRYIDENDALIKALIAPVLDDMIADTALTANDFRIVDNTLYRITTSVAAGAALTPNTNCTATTIGAILKTLLT